MDMPQELNNQELIEEAKTLHGQLYHRINSLQVQVNRLREENKRLKKNQFTFDYKVTFEVP